jgi:hypothetical protein
VYLLELRLRKCNGIYKGPEVRHGSRVVTLCDHACKTNQCRRCWTCITPCGKGLLIRCPNCSKHLTKGLHKRAVKGHWELDDDIEYTRWAANATSNWSSSDGGNPRTPTSPDRVVDADHLLAETAPNPQGRDSYDLERGATLDLGKGWCNIRHRCYRVQCRTYICCNQLKAECPDLYPRCRDKDGYEILIDHYCSTCMVTTGITSVRRHTATALAPSQPPRLPRGPM